MANVDGRTMAIAMTPTAGVDRTGIDPVKTIAPTGLTEKSDKLISHLDDAIKNLAEIHQIMVQTDEDLVGLCEDMKQLSQTTARLYVKVLPLFT